MNQYLVMYQPPNDNKYFPSIKTWPEILTMLARAEEVGGEFRFYRLEKGFPDRVWAVRVKQGSYYLADMYRNRIEG